MSLQLALLAAGVVVVVVVVAFGLYDRKRRRQSVGAKPGNDAETAGVLRLRAPHAAVPSVTLTFDVDPAPDTAIERRQLKPDAPLSSAEPSKYDAITEELEVLEDVAQVPLNLGAAPARPDEKPSTPAAPDEKIDFIVNLPGDGPVERDTVLGIFKQHEYRLEKPRRLYGKHYQGALWSDVARDSAGVRYSDIALAIQLLDGRGPIDESELNTFAQIGLKLADALQRATKLSLTFEQALARAKELQVFSEAYDVIAGVTIAARGAAFGGRAIEQAAARAGLKFGARNIFHMKNDLSPGCRHLFSMANLFQPGDFNPNAWDSFETKGLALFMSVPCAHRPGSVFLKMVTAAKVLCEALGGELQDQDKKPLSDKGLVVIRRQIEEIDKRMTEYDVVPGSRTALRLFRESLIA